MFLGRPVGDYERSPGIVKVLIKSLSANLMYMASILQ